MPMIEVLGRQQAFGPERVSGDRIDRGPAQAGTDEAEHHQGADQPQEQEDRIGQAIADALDGVEDAGSDGHASLRKRLGSGAFMGREGGRSGNRPGLRQAVRKTANHSQEKPFAAWV
jgi:hypothetical protein